MTVEGGSDQSGPEALGKYFKNLMPKSVHIERDGWEFLFLTFLKRKGNHSGAFL